MSHKDTIYNFIHNDCVLIYGLNESDSGADSNGAGKSTILEAITIAVTGETNRTISRDEFINDNSDETYIEFHLKNDVCSVKDLIIKRWFYRKKTSKIELWENGELNTQMTSVLEANKRIFDLLGISKEDLLHFFIIGQETNYSFLSATDTEKKSIIARFSDVKFIDDKIEELKSKRKLKGQEADDIQSKIDKIDGKIESINEQIEDEENNAKDDLKGQIKVFEDDIKSKTEKKQEYSKKIEEIKEKCKTEKNKLDDEKFDLILKSKKLNEIKRKRKTEKRELEKEKDEAEATLRKLNLLNEDEIECPKCEHHFIPDSEISLEELPKMIEEVNELILDLSEMISSKNKSVDKIQSKLDKIDELEIEKDAIEEKIEEYDNEESRFNNKIKQLDKLIEADDKSIEKLKESASNADKINSLREKLAIEKENLSNQKDEMKKIDDEIEDLDFWIHHFGRKGFQTFLTNKSIKSIEGITNSYLQKINTDLQLNIDGFTVLKSGDIREKIDVNIIRNGTVVGSFNRYSGGERGRIKLANILAMQKLFNMTAPNGGLNFLGLDEVFEGLDATGQRELISILENMNVTTMVVSHRNQSIGADNEVIVEKVDGYSIVIQ